jgi:fatty acid desaturase
MYLVYQCVLFYGIYIGSAINHFVPQVADKIPHEHINKYAYYICHNTTNFSLNNKFWFWYTGGFNIQIEHHLIPFVPVENLRRMTKIVKELCEKYNYPYKEFKTMSQLWKEHYNYLAIMANAEITEIIKTEINNKHSYEAR